MVKEGELCLVIFYEIEKYNYQNSNGENTTNYLLSDFFVSFSDWKSLDWKVLFCMIKWETSIRFNKEAKGDY